MSFKPPAPAYRYSMALGAAAALASPLASPALAADASLKLELPRLTVAEYHRPYVAVWIERPADQSFSANLAVWYDIKKRDDGGAKWLKDMRQWWRKSGRELQTPADGITAATRAPGEHTLNLSASKTLATLPPGNYQMVVEAAREGGGREVLRLSFDWPARGVQSARAQGEHELGAVALELKP